MYRIYRNRKTHKFDTCNCGNIVFKLLTNNQDECIDCNVITGLANFEELMLIYDIIDCKNKKTLKLLYG